VLRLPPLLVPDHRLCKMAHINPATFCQCPVCNPSIHVSKKLLKRGPAVHKKVDTVVEGRHNQPINHVSELTPASINQSGRNRCYIIIHCRHSCPTPPSLSSLSDCGLHRYILGMANIQAVVHSTLSVISCNPCARLSILHHMATRAPSGRRSKRPIILRLNPA
jgi:hypothetical protein